MKTLGHHKVAEIAGEPLLNQVFSEAFGEEIPLEAFYMGNWLTDVAQSFDPVAGATAINKVDFIVDKAFSYLPTYITYGKTTNELDTFDKIFSSDLVVKRVQAQKAALKQSLRDLLVAFTEPHQEGPSLWFKACQNSFFLKAYLKFVHPKKSKQEENVSKPLRMDMGVFKQLFDTFFTQYWPHDHMDRPVQIPIPEGPSIVPYDMRRPAPGPDGKEPPGLYTYIHEFMELAAADLADLDLNWARDYLSNPPPAASLRTDFNFQRGLANLGRALHSVEDFFAHSNYIEHAAKVMGTNYIPHDYQYDNFRFLKRLKRLPLNDLTDFPDYKWQDEDDEPHVVSGYFDFQDTLVSLLHLAEGPIMGMMQREPKDVTLELRHHYDYITDPDYADNYLEQEGDQMMADMMEVFKDPKAAWKNQNNLFRQGLDEVFRFVDAQDFVDKVDSIAERLTLQNPAAPEEAQYYRHIMKEMPFFRALEAQQGLSPDQLLWLYSAALLFVRYMIIKWQLRGRWVSLWDIIKRLLYIYFLPNKAIKKYLKDFAKEWLADRAIFFAKEKVFDAIAADRIGCHSLMSKDHGSEWLYTPMRNCAMGAHYYIVKNILRWHAYRTQTIPENRKYIDWNDVLTHITTHPAVGVVYTIVHPIPTSMFHNLTEADMQRPLRDIFKEVANQYMPLTMETVRTTFDDKKIIWGNIPSMIRNMNPAAVKELAVAQVIAPGWVPVLAMRRIIVPYIKYKLGVSDPTKINPRWYMALMQMNWKPEQKLSTMNMYHTLRYHPNAGVAVVYAERADQLRQILQNRYQP